MEPLTVINKLIEKIPWEKVPWPIAIAILLAILAAPVANGLYVAGACLGFIAAYYGTRQLRRWRDAKRRRLVVLPFTVSTADNDRHGFAFGLTEELTTRFSGISDLQVVSIGSAWKYAAAERDYAEIRDELRVVSVLEGSVHFSNGRVIIHTRLTDVSTQTQLWTERFEESFTPADLAEIQQRIAIKVTGRVRGRLTGEQRSRLASTLTHSTEALELYYRGREAWERRSKEWLPVSKWCFEQAIEKDSGFARAYAGLADCYGQSALYAVAEPRVAMPVARKLAEQALAIDCTRAEGHASVGFVEGFYEWNWEAAGAALERSNALQPNYTSGLMWRSFLMMALEQWDDALATIERARSTDPRSASVHATLGWMLYYARSYDQAIVAFEASLKENEGFALAMLGIGAALAERGDFDEAFPWLNRAVDVSLGNPIMVGYLGRAHALSGNREGAWEALRRLEERAASGAFVPVNTEGWIYAALGETHRALEALRYALQERSWHMIFLNISPIYDDLRSEPEFRELVEAVGLPLPTQAASPDSACLRRSYRRLHLSALLDRTLPRPPISPP